MTSLRFQSVFDIIGPVMIGPSSSHTAGAVRIGKIVSSIFNDEPTEVEFQLFNSFAKTYRGHGTDLALVAGILGMDTDDTNIPNSFEIAKKENLQYKISTIELKDAHPNTALLELTGENGRELKIVASSLGGGRISVEKIDDIETHFTGEYPTLIVHNLDQPGHVAEVASMLSHKSINIATLNLYRDKRGGYAVMVVETDQTIPEDSIKWLEHLEGVIKVTYLDIT